MTIDKNAIFNFFKSPKTQNPVLDENARLQAFIDAFPGEYCGLNKNGSMAYSKGFCNLLGLTTVNNFTDIQSRLEPGDAAALESLFSNLIKKGEKFSLHTTTIRGANLKITGTRGQNTEQSEIMAVLWAEPIEKKEEDEPEEKQKPDELLQLQIAMNSIPRPLWLRDKDQDIIWCNNSYAQYLDMDSALIIEQQKEVATKPLKKKGEEDKKIGRALAKEAIEKGEALETKAHGIFEGKRLLMKLSEIPLGPLSMTLGIAYNITREEELETELQRYQSSNKELLEQLGSAIALYSADKHLEFYNSAFAQLWDLEAGWLNKKPSLGEIMEKLRETRRLPEQSDFRRFKQNWLDMFTNLIQPHEDMLFLPDGSTYRMLVIPHSGGGLMMNFEDVTSRLELESSYNTLIAVQKETLDNLVEGVSVFGSDGRLKLWNQAFSRLWNLHPEELDSEPHITKILDKMQSFFTEDTWESTRQTFLNKALERSIYEDRLHLSTETLLEYSTMPLPDGGILISYSDITDSVRVENALREKNTALETAEQLKLDFLANVSYQLRTPLNAIMGFNDILDQEFFGALNDKQKEYTEGVKTAGEHLTSLINDILDLSTLEAGYMDLQRDEIKIYTVIKSVQELMEDWARKKKIEITVSCAKNIGTMQADEKRIKQAIVNIIRNAITFTPEGGKIDLKAKRLKSGLEIQIHDTGIGITEKDRKRIFEPFERAGSGAANATLTRGGAGLGLSLVKNIIALHGGHVTLDSQPNEGTTVTLFLPFLSTKTDLKIPL